MTHIRCNAHAIVSLVTSPPQAAVVSWEFSHHQERTLYEYLRKSVE